MIKVDFKVPSARELMRAAMKGIERGIAEEALRAAARHGGVTVAFDRKPDGTIRAANFRGSEAAVEAARFAIAN